MHEIDCTQFRWKDQNDPTYKLSPSQSYNFGTIKIAILNPCRKSLLSEGDKGETGQKGLAGIQGEKGEPGVDGAKGDKGPDGNCQPDDYTPCNCDTHVLVKHSQDGSVRLYSVHCIFHVA